MRFALPLVCALATTAAADVELKNDGLQTGQMGAAQGGFVAGEIAASRFVAPDAGRTLLKVQLLYGGATATRTITLRVFDDTAGTLDPGSPLYTGDFQLTGSNDALQEIATTDMQVVVPAQFRVGIQFGDGCPAAPQPCGAPSVVSAQDTIDPTKNFIFAIPGGWISSQTAGVSGNWVIRAFVSGTGGPGPGPGPGPSGGDCTANPDCPTGEFCDTAAGSCTFECRTSPDCGDGTCNSLGQCVGGGDGGGCCQSSRDGELPALLGVGVLGLLVLRRRRCAR